MMTRQRRGGLDQRRFARAIFTDDDRDRSGEVEREVVCQPGQIKGIGPPVADPVRQQGNAPKVRCDKSDRSLASGHPCGS
jgi:hypothetical protein